MKSRTTILAIILLSLPFLASRETKAQDFPPDLAAKVPGAFEKLLSNDVRERVSLLDVLVVEVRESCTGEHTFPFDLKRSDYSFVVRKILEMDLTALDEQTLARALHKMAQLVRKFGLNEFAGPISKYMAHENWRIQVAALSMLDSMRAKDFDAEIAPLLSSSNKYVRDEALNVLVRLGSKKAVPSLVSLLYSADHLQRYYALQRLVLINGREASPHIAKLLRDEDANNRYWALDALVKLNAKEQAADIWFLTTGQTPKTEAYAIAALVSFGDAKAINLAMEKIADGVDQDNNITAKTTLSGEILNGITELKAKAIIPRLIALLENPPPTAMHRLFGRTDIVYALGKLDAKESAPVLRNHMATFPRGRIPAIQVLGDFRDAESVDDLLNIFLTYLPKPSSAITNDTYEGAEAAVALAKIGDKKTWKMLIDAAENPHYPYRSFVIQELNKHINPALWKRMEDARVTGLDFKSIKENAEAFAKESGIQIELEYDPYRHFFKFHRPGVYPFLRTVPNWPLKNKLGDIVSAIDSDTLPNRFTYIMDGEKIRILPVEDAVQWWRTNILKKQLPK